MVNRIAVCCRDVDVPHFEQGIRQFSEKHAIQIQPEFHNKTVDFLKAVERDSLWDFLTVAIPGARGMETVISTRVYAPETPLLWCSDDIDFGVASYRLHCNLFLTLPLKPEDVEMALERCLHGMNS